jgi:hypothetical protein
LARIGTDIVAPWRKIYDAKTALIVGGLSAASQESLCRRCLRGRISVGSSTSESDTRGNERSSAALIPISSDCDLSVCDRVSVLVNDAAYDYPLRRHLDFQILLLIAGGEGKRNCWATFSARPVAVVCT